MSKILVDTIDTRSGTSNITIGSSNASQITLKSGATLTNFPNNTPTFLVNRASSAQTISDNTFTKVQFNNEQYDTDNVFDNSSNYRFTVPSAGKYFLHTNVWMRGTDVSMLNYYYLAFYKNGSNIWEQHSNFTNNDIRSFGANMAVILDLSASDYIEVFGRISINSGSPQFGYNAGQDKPTTWFQGYKLIGT